MGAFFRMADAFLRGRGPFAADAPLAGRLTWLFAFIIVGGLVYGAVMGSFAGLEPGRYQQLLYSGVKVPMLLLVTFFLCVPSFFVINAVVGLADDFGHALQAIVGAQACVSLALAGLAPLTAVFYLSMGDYLWAVLFNAVMFGIASLSAQVIIRRYYRPLIRKNPRHRFMLYAWFSLYAFVGIQMGWVLRPFIGDPHSPPMFFRPEAWGNAYVVIGRLIAHAWNTFFSW